MQCLNAAFRGWGAISESGRDWVWVLFSLATWWATLFSEGTLLVKRKYFRAVYLIAAFSMSCYCPCVCNASIFMSLWTSFGSRQRVSSRGVVVRCLATEGYCGRKRPFVCTTGHVIGQNVAVYCPHLVPLQFKANTSTHFPYGLTHSSRSSELSRFRERHIVIGSALVYFLMWCQ